MPRLPLTLTLFSERKRGRAATIERLGAGLALADLLLSLAGEGGAKRRMRVSRGADRSSANKGLV